jgi:transposase-like protein
LTPVTTTGSMPGMEDYPRTMIEFEQRFATEAACREYVRQLRWPGGFECAKCGGRAAWETGRGLFHCETCGHQSSLTAGTIFHRSRKPLALWFRAMWQLTSQKYGANALGLQRVLGLGSYHTAWEWLHRLRRAMVRSGRDTLSGTVEADESYVGGERPGKRGRGADNKALVMVAVEEVIREGKKELGRIRLRRVSDASAVSIQAFIDANIAPGSTVRSDGWDGYGRVASHGFGHEVARKDALVGDDLLPACHRVISLFKRWLLGTYQGAVQPDQLDYYLDEFTFRFNRRSSSSRGKLFYRLVQQAVDTEPIPRCRIEGGSPL